MKIGKFCYSKKDMRRAAALLRMDDLAVLEKRSEAALAALYDASISVHSDKIDIPTAIIRRSDTSLRRSSAKRMIAVLAASLVLIFAMTMAVSASARQMTLDFIRRVFPEEDRVSYEFNEDRNIQNPNQLPELTLNVP
ncbi:MAG: hypothetical protein IJM08_00430, partial [Firmicutes bacterium]|nr:hypothetical protein [Bacillota bacterium]